MRFILLTMLCTIFLNGFAQPKKSNTINIKGVDFKEAVNQLLDQGYSIAKMDSSFQIISTSPQTIKNVAVVFNLRVKDSTLNIRGTWDDLISVRIGAAEVRVMSEPIRNIGMKGSSANIAFAAMNKFAQSFGKDVEYKVNQ